MHVEVYHHDGIGCAALQVPLLYAEEQVAVLVDGDVTKTQRLVLGRQRLGLAVGQDSVQSLVHEIAEIDDAAARCVGLAPILVDLGTCIESWTENVVLAAVLHAPHDDSAALLRRPRLRPVDALTVYREAREGD